jgi:hypothetical protein
MVGLKTPRIDVNFLEGKTRAELRKLWPFAL